MTTREKILIFRPDHIGDLLLTTPAIYALRKAKPRAHISVLTSSWSSPILLGNPDIDDILICDLPWLDRGENPSWLPLLPTIHQIRTQQYDHILNFRIAAKAAAFSRLLGAKERWGFDVLKSRWAWTHTAPYDPNQHVVDNYMALARTYTRSEDTPVHFRIFPETADLSAVDEFMHNSPLAVVLGVTSGRPDKSWLPDRWATVADHIAKDGFRILLNGGPTEETDVQMVQSLMHHPAENLVGRFSLLQFAGLLKRCAAIITLDSFPMHLAAALGIPTIALFGANSSTLWGPYPGNYPRIIVEPPPEIPRNAQAMQWIQTTHVINAYNRLNLQAQHNSHL